VFTKLAKHDDDEGEGDEGEEVGFEFFIAGGNSAELFDFVEETLDFVALLVALLVIDDDIQAVGLGGDNRLDALGFEPGAEGMAVIGLVQGGLLEPIPRVDGIDDRFADRGISHRPHRDPDIHPLRFRRAPGMDVGGQTAAGAADGLIAFFLAAPAACWWARTTVESSNTIFRVTPATASAASGYPTTPHA
jgi:hypothetical protein